MKDNVAITQSSPEPPTIEDPSATIEKPPYSYVAMIVMAISGLGGKATLDQIYQYIEETFIYYRTREKRRGWQNSIRHNLSLNRSCFMKVAKDGIITPAGRKGNFWILRDGVTLCSLFEEGNCRRRRRTLHRPPTKNKRNRKNDVKESGLHSLPHAPQPKQRGRRKRADTTVQSCKHIDEHLSPVVPPATNPQNADPPSTDPALLPCAQVGVTFTSPFGAKPEWNTPQYWKNVPNEVQSLSKLTADSLTNWSGSSLPTAYPIQGGLCNPGGVEGAHTSGIYLPRLASCSGRSTVPDSIPLPQIEAIRGGLSSPTAGETVPYTAGHTSVDMPQPFNNGACQNWLHPSQDSYIGFLSMANQAIVADGHAGYHSIGSSTAATAASAVPIFSPQSNPIAGQGDEYVAMLDLYKNFARHQLAHNHTGLATQWYCDT